MGGYGNPQPGSSSLRKIIEADSVDVCKDTLQKDTIFHYKSYEYWIMLPTKLEASKRSPIIWDSPNDHLPIFPFNRYFYFLPFPLPLPDPHPLNGGKVKGGKRKSWYRLLLHKSIQYGLPKIAWCTNWHILSSLSLSSIPHLLVPLDSNLSHTIYWNLFGIHYLLSDVLRYSTMNGLKVFKIMYTYI